MNKKLIPYFLSRIAISITFGFLFFVTGSPIWLSLLVSGTLIALFLYAPRSGRYSVHPEFGITALRRDERTQKINDVAGRNAFVVIMLVIGALVIYYGSLGTTTISLSMINIVMAIGILTYFISDFWLRKSHQ